MSDTEVRQAPLPKIFHTTIPNNVDQTLQGIVDISLAKLKRHQKKSQNSTKMIDLLRAFKDNVRFDTSRQFLTNLVNFQTLRQYSDDWRALKTSKLFQLILLLWDQQLTELSQCTDNFELIALLFLEEHLYVHNQMQSSQVLPGFVQLLTRLSSKFYGQIYDESVIQVDYFNLIMTETQPEELLIWQFVTLLEQFFQKKNQLSNFNLLFGTLTQNLKSIKKPSPQLTKLIEVLEEQEEDRGQLLIIPDLPIMKVFPLTPRIKEEFLTGKKTEEPELAKLKKKQKLVKKQLTRELVEDQKVVNQLMHEREQHRKEKLNMVLKKDKRIMEDAQVEYKKLKTQQLNIKRNKKKSTRVAGNKK